MDNNVNKLASRMVGGLIMYCENEFDHYHLKKLERTSFQGFLSGFGMAIIEDGIKKNTKEKSSKNVKLCSDACKIVFALFEKLCPGFLPGYKITPESLKKLKDTINFDSSDPTKRKKDSSKQKSNIELFFGSKFNNNKDK